jgi:2,5-furandicarboxylate decarboxylase 1
VGKEAEILRNITLPGVKAVHLTEGGCGVFHAVVAIDKLYEGYGKMVGLAVFGSPSGRHIKQVTVVDQDVDPFNSDAVEWAVATRVQAHRDIEIMSGLTGIFLDPSLPKEEQEGPARTSKILVDATRYDAKDFAPVCLPARDAMVHVDKNWQRYGISRGKSNQ